MDQAVLVSAGHALLDVLEKKGITVRAAMWVHNADVDTWKLWIVPPKDITDKREFYRKVAEAISENDEDMLGIDPSDTEMISENHPGIVALSRVARVDNKGAIHLHNNRYNDFYLTDGIILRMAI